MERLLNKGLQCVAAGANVPFADQDLFFGETARWVDERCSLIPDFVANCGMARVFAYLMSNKDVEISDEAIFGDVSRTIRNALFEVYKRSTSKQHITLNALTHSLSQLV